MHGQSIGDDYRVALLDEDHYFPDGQIKEEDYEYGSFVQSRMFHAGVTCSDCHEPHSSKLRADGNALCARCHSAQKYDSPAHHFHQVGSAGTRCVECHMPTRTYMVIDARRDHSIRIRVPTYRSSSALPTRAPIATPTSLPIGRRVLSASGTAMRLEGFQQFAEILNAGSAGAPGARQSLERLVADTEQPAIARATALSLLANYAPPPTDEAVRAGITDDWSLVRRASAHALSNTDPAASANALAPLFDDRVRSVRIEAAEVLAGLPVNNLPADVAAAFDPFRPTSTSPRSS